MKILKGYNKVQSKNRIFGLEFLDLLILLCLYMVVFIFSVNLFMNLAIVFAAYFFLWLYKKGKPGHWTGSVVRFLLRSKNYPVKRENQKDIFNL